MSRTRVAALATVAVLLVVALGTVWWLRHDPGPQRRPVAEASARPTEDWSAAAPEVTDAVEKAPEAGADAFAPGTASQVDGPVASALPTGTTIAVQDGSWSPDGYGGGTVVAAVTYPGQAPRNYLVLVVREQDEWKIAATTELGA